MDKPIRRHPFRRRLGKEFYTLKRWARWIFGSQKFAQGKSKPLEIKVFEHATPLFRPLKNADMALQKNKVTNLRLAAEQLHSTVIRPGETLSFWRLVGRPTRAKGYLEGMVLENGQVGKGIGGGLCQLGNLLHWMALHSPLRVAERWRHSFDVFPDENRVLPFGSGATLAYNYLDLQLKNETAEPFQILVWLTETELCGEIRASQPPAVRFQVIEKEHVIEHEAWGGYSRHNKLARQIFDAQTDQLLGEEVILENHALLMYQHFLN